jgi:hypothetical protein
MDSAPQRKPNYEFEIAVGIGYVMFFAALVTACIAAYAALLHARPKAAATSTPYPTPVTPIAHFVGTPAADKPGVWLDDFGTFGDTKYRDWWRTSRSQVSGGKLTIENLGENDMAHIICGTCLSVLRPYYLQVDLATDAATAEIFGLIVNSRNTVTDYYLFVINTESHEYYLYHHGYDGWSTRAAGISDKIRSYPNTNTLAVYANSSVLELYANGRMLDRYEDASTAFERGLIGIYSQGRGYQLQVDNLMVEMVGDY